MNALTATSNPKINLSEVITTIVEVANTRSGKPIHSLVSQRQYFYVMRYILTLQMAITIGGIASNLLCIRTFFRIGLKECVTITFFSIAISDLCFLTIEIFHWISTLLFVVEVHTVFGVQTQSLIFFVNLPREIFFFASSYFIPFLAVQRSLCVLLPLHFKNMFTRNRTFIIISALWGYSLFCKALDFSIYGLSKQWSATTNSTVLALYFPRPVLRKHVSKWTNIMNNVILYILTNTVVVGSLFVLTYALKKSARFREKTSTSGIVVTSQKDPKGNTGSEEAKLKEQGKASNSRSSGASSSSSKERQAIVQVGILSALYLLAFLPASVLFILRYAIPWLFRAEYFFFLSLYIEIFMTFIMANASVNFLVYYRYNSTFRQRCFNRQ